MIMKDNELDRHSPLSEIIKCMLVAVQNLSSNEYIYQDDEAGTNISIEEVNVIINQLSHSNVDAIEIADYMEAEAYRDVFEPDKVIVIGEGDGSN